METKYEILKRFRSFECQESIASALNLKKRQVLQTLQACHFPLWSSAESYSDLLTFGREWLDVPATPISNDRICSIYKATRQAAGVFERLSEEEKQDIKIYKVEEDFCNGNSIKQLIAIYGNVVPQYLSDLGFPVPVELNSIGSLTLSDLDSAVQKGRFHSSWDLLYLTRRIYQEWNDGKGRLK